MGIQGLLPMLKSVIHDDHISSLKGRRLAVDTYAWLHKAAYSCASDLCEGRTTTKWISYILYMVDMLLEFNIEVTLVFDGKELPAKMGTEKDRASNRALNLAKAREYTKAGENDKAFNCYTQAVDISPRMAAELIAVIRQHRPNVKIVVAPYEADAQLAFLCSANLVDGVVSEDSDTVPYGCSCVVYKLQKTGKCQVYHRTDLYSVDIPSFDMRAFTPAMTISMCIIAGCDYLSNAKGVGIKKAYELVSRQKEPDRILRKMRLENLLPLLFVSAQPTFSVSAAAFQQSVKSLLIYDVEFYKVRVPHPAIFFVALRPPHSFSHTHTSPSYAHAHTGTFNIQPPDRIRSHTPLLSASLTNQPGYNTRQLCCSWPSRHDICWPSTP
jgi:exonuclease-1